MAAPNPRDERTARVIDREVAPLWHDRFARMMWRHLGGESPNLVLDVHAGPGRTAAELLKRLPASSKIIALEPDMTVCAEAASGEQALVLYRTHRPDVTLMDQRLPGLSGSLTRGNGSW